MFHFNAFERIPDDRYARQLRKGFRWLRFEPVIESEYRHMQAESER